ncbi:hypothetical protein [Rhizobium sp. HT1-10]|uniref:hypothetical protein n=1 Tax=Rhizobium sp. HT1-10 TaxID=3111638 RepID=UPI003C28A496
MTHTPANHPSITSRSVEYSNHHLQPFRHALVGHGPSGSDLIVRVSFTCHVYSKMDTAQAIEFRFIDEGRRWREFCPVRHLASVDLPALCRTMMNENFPSWLSKDRNGQSNMAITERQPTSGSRYAVFYYLYPSRAKNIHVEFVVKSAYRLEIDMAHYRKRELVKSLLKTCYYKQKAIP